MDESRNGYRRRLNRLIALVGEENYRNDPVVHAYLRQAAASATETLQGDLAKTTICHDPILRPRRRYDL